MTERTPGGLFLWQVLEVMDEVDVWIAQGRWKSKDDLERARSLHGQMQAAVDAGNLAAAEAWVHYFDLLRWTQRRVEFLMPLARVGKHLEHKLKPGEKSTVYMPQRTATDRKARDERMLRALLAGESPREVAAREGVHPRTAQRLLKGSRGPATD